MIQLNHIALLVRSARSGAGLLKKYGLVTGPLQTWEGEGTLEVYAGEESLSARLLLMEAVKSGAYARALEKRGPGLHHLAVDVPDLGSYIAGLSGSGWLRGSTPGLGSLALGWVAVWISFSFRIETRV